MIQIRTFNAQQLSDYTGSQEYEAHDFVPISRHRALSHIHNPRSQADDILLLMAYEDQKPVGYLGLLPDLIFNGHKEIRCAWMSCIWIDERQRGKGIARLLTEKADEIWQHKIMGTDFAEASGSLFDKMGIFDELPLKEGIRLYVRSDLHNILPPKKAIFRKWQPILKGIDGLVNLVFDLRFYFVRRARFHIDMITALDTDTRNFIMEHNSGELFRRGPRELEWMLKYPWVLASGEDALSRKYHFSSVDKSFDFHVVRLKDKDTLAAVLFFTKRSSSLKLPYVYIKAGYEPQVAACIEDLLIKWRIHTFTCFHPVLSGIFRRRQTIALFKKTIKRRYVITKTLKKQLADPEAQLIQDGDADAAFT